jgi:hypothetical protein
MGKLVRGGSRAELNRQVRIAAMLALAYWAHPLPVILSGGFQVCLFVIEQWQASSEKSTSCKGILTKFAEAVWPWLLPLGLCVWFAVRLISSEVMPVEGSTMTLLRDRFLDLMHMNGFLNMSPTPTSGGVFVLLLGVLSAGAVLTGGRRCAPARSISIFTFALIATYFLVPDKVGNGGFVAIRILFNLVVFVTVLALSPGRIETGYLSLCSLLASICIFSFGAEYLLVAKRLAPAVKELRVAMADVPRNSTVVMLTYRLTPDCGRWPLVERAKPERHLAFFLAAERELIALNNYEPASGQFPVLYRGASFPSLIGEFEFTDENQHRWVDALQKSSGIDYVVSWGTPSGVQICPAPVGAPLKDSLAKNYDLLVRKTGASLVEIWKRRVNP